MAKSYSENNVTVFISYKHNPYSTVIARDFHNALTDNYGYKVFWDQESLQAGDEWNTKIYKKIRDSDVLLLLLDAEHSDFIHREISMARGAGVGILPLVITNDDVGAVLKEYDLTDFQYVKFQPQDYLKLTEDGFKDVKPELILDIERLAKYTREQQQQWMGELGHRRRNIKADDRRSIRSYRVALTDDSAYQDEDFHELVAKYADSEDVLKLKQAGFHNCEIHLSTGDMLKLTGTDVLVNTENNYLQMARFFETSHMSSALRREGAYLVGGRLKHDTVQIELLEQVNRIEEFCDYGLPIEIGQVIPTNGGHPSGKLVTKNKVRYIFHAAIVRVDPHNMGSIAPIETNQGIIRTINNALNLVIDIHQDKGAKLLQLQKDVLAGDLSSDKGIVPEGDKKNTSEAAKAYKPIKSIGFPIFGTGHAGRLVREVFPVMINAFKSFLLDNYHYNLEEKKHAEEDKDYTPNYRHLPLERISISIYSKSDIEMAIRAMNDRMTVINRNVNGDASEDTSPEKKPTTTRKTAAPTKAKSS